MAVITINGREFPAPDVGGNLVVATNVSSGKTQMANLLDRRLAGININSMHCSGNSWMQLPGQLCCRNLTNL